MKRDYLAENAAKKKVTSNAMLALFIFVVLFIIIMLRVALRSGADGGFFSSMPSDEQAFAVAKVFVKPTLRSTNGDFAQDDFQCVRGADSVYTVKSWFETKDTGEGKVRTHFSITLRYNGGSPANDANWSMENIQEK